MNSLWIPPKAAVEFTLSTSVKWVEGELVEALELGEAITRLSAPWQLVLPVEAITACAVQLPKTRGRLLRQALPFAVEEQLAEDVEHMHLSMGAQLADGRHRVFAVNKDWLARLLDVFPVHPSTIFVDADLLPPVGTQLCWLEGRWLLGGEGPARVALSDQDWLLVQDLCSKDVHSYGPEEKHLESTGSHSVMLEPERWLSGQEGSCNLAQAEFALKNQSDLWQRFKPLAFVAGICLGLQVIFNIAQAWYFEKEARMYQNQSMALYQSFFPEDTRIVNLRAQFDQHLLQASQSDLLNILNQLTVIEGLRIESLHFDEQKVRLNAQAANMLMLEEATSQLEANGMVVTLDAPRAHGSGVVASIVIGEQG